MSVDFNSGGQVNGLNSKPVKRARLPVECRVDENCTIEEDTINHHVSQYLVNKYPQSIPLGIKLDTFANESGGDGEIVQKHVKTIYIGAPSGPDSLARSLPTSSVELRIFSYICYSDSEEYDIEADSNGNDDSDGGDGGGKLAFFRVLELPAPQLEDRWESLVFDDAIPQRLLDYTITLASFSDRNVDQSLVSWNRVALLHGEPGTGKTTLCKALAQKAAIRLGGACALCEVNTHSLFSKWFSESGKLVKQAFSRILTEIEADRIFVLVDEVESLTASRAAAANSNGAEPTDAIRVVNAVLTELDRLARDPRVIVLTTSNITGAIDAAFVDRADIKQYIGPPSARAIYAILVSCIQELAKRGIINDNVEFEDSRNVFDLSISSQEQQKKQQQQQQQQQQHQANGHSSQDWMLSDESRILKSLAERCVGMSGRTLRRLPFIATALFQQEECVTTIEFLNSLEQAIDNEHDSRSKMDKQTLP